MGITMLYKPLELVIILVMGFLMGINIMLLLDSLTLVAKKSATSKKQKGNVSLGLGVIGMLVTTGCASCGITLVSFLGPTLSLSLIPFQGVLIQGISLILLVISLVHILNRRNQNCIVTSH